MHKNIRMRTHEYTHTQAFTYTHANSRTNALLGKITRLPYRVQAE